MDSKSKVSPNNSALNHLKRDSKIDLQNSGKREKKYEKIKEEKKSNKNISNNLANKKGNNKSKTKKLKLESKHPKSIISKQKSKFSNSYNNKILSKNQGNSSKNELKFSSKIVKMNINNNLTPIKEEKKKKMDAFELSELEYEEAIIYDKRSCIRTYWDILSREHQIIFTFFICKDYNIINVKYARFLFLFANDMAMNVFFFSDESMHKIFLNYGKYNFIQQIPQIIYSTIISQIIEVFLCFLSLTDKHIYQIKNLESNNKNVILKTLKVLKIKLIVFFVFTFLLFWFC